MLERFDPNRQEHFLAASLGLTLLGLALRLCAARGDLWLDEVWSVRLVGQVHSAGQVFWSIRHDNNHFLNSLWIFTVGQHASAMTYRLPSVLFSTASIPAAGWAAMRNGRVAALAGMLLFATSFPMVDYGSQARGYSGLILFTLLGTGYALRAVAVGQPLRRRLASWMLGLCLGAGFLCHSLMVIPAAILGLAVAVRFYQTRDTRLDAAARTVGVVFPGILMMLPTAILLAAQQSGFEFGSILPFDLKKFWVAYGTLLLSMVGMVPVFAPAALPAVLLAMGSETLFRRMRDPLYFIAIVAVPIALCAAAPKNSGIARYFLPFGVFFLIGIADRIGAALHGPKQEKLVARAAMLALLVANAATIFPLVTHGRGDYQALFAGMVRKGAISYGASIGTAQVMVDYYGRRLAATVTQTPAENWCADPPDWLILADEEYRPAARIASALEQHCGLALQSVPFTEVGLSMPGWHFYQILHPPASQPLP